MELTLATPLIYKTNMSSSPSTCDSMHCPKSVSKSTSQCAGNDFVDHQVLLEVAFTYIETLRERMSNLNCDILLFDNQKRMIGYFGEKSHFPHFEVNKQHEDKSHPSSRSRVEALPFTLDTGCSGVQNRWLTAAGEVASVLESCICLEDSGRRIGGILVIFPTFEQASTQSAFVHSISLGIATVYSLKRQMLYPAAEQSPDLNQLDIIKLKDVEKLSTLTALTAGIAHEIRNPLTTAKGFLQLFMKRATSADDKNYLTLTINELNRIQSLLTDFMGIARPEKLMYGFTDLREIVHDIANFLYPEATLRNVVLQLDPGTRPVSIYGDRNRVKQVLINIVQNAIHACHTQGHVKISLITEFGKAIVRIRDNGCGIADTSQLFRAFYTTKPHGTGLGLIVSKTILEEDGGTMDIDSIVGEGTAVTLQFPTEPLYVQP